MPKRSLLWSFLISLLPLLGWWTYGLTDLDEGFYAAVVSEMNRRGEWITPFYNGKPWFEKPILLYWFAKPSLAIFGEMIGPRLPSILATVATYGLVIWFCKRRVNLAAAVLAPMILASSLLFVVVGRLMMTDPLLIMAMTGAMVTFWESLVGDTRWRLATAAFLGLGVLAKGPVACLLFVIVAAVLYIRRPEMRADFKGQWGVGTLILIAVVASWYLPAYLVNGRLFVDEFLIRQNIGRFTGGDEAHTLGGLGSLALYIPIFLLGMAPWSFLSLRAYRRKGDDPQNDAMRTFLRVWAVGIFLFFTISGAKLVHYIVPMFPPVAILVADDLIRRWNGFSWRRVAPWLAWGAFMTILVWGALPAYYYGVILRLPEGREVALVSGQAEVHNLCRYVRSHAQPGDVVAEYEMGRRQKDLGTGKLKLQQTSLPSSVLYLNSTMVDTDSWLEILAHRTPVWVITRFDRVGATETASAGLRLERVKTPVKQDQYALWYLRPSP